MPGTASEEDSYLTRLGRSVQRIRKRLFAINQAEMGERVGVDLNTISRWENGRTSLSAYDLTRLWRGLGVPAEWVLDPTDSMTELDRRIALLKAPALNEQIRRARRVYWLSRAAERLALSTQQDRLRLLGWPTTLRQRLSAIEGGAADPRPDEVRDFARAYRIPERILTDPPETDAERLDEWQEIELAEIAPEQTRTRRERRRAS